MLSISSGAQRRLLHAVWTTICLLRGIASFALMPNGENQHSVMLFLVAVQSDVARPTPRNNQLSHVVFSRTTNEWMILENLHCFRNKFSCFQGCGRLRLEEEICEPYKVGKRLRRINQLRQDLAFGLGTALPRARA
jgi:hypothetical protein